MSHHEGHSFESFLVLLGVVFRVERGQAVLRFGLGEILAHWGRSLLSESESVWCVLFILDHWERSSASSMLSSWLVRSLGKGFASAGSCIAVGGSSSACVGLEEFFAALDSGVCGVLGHLLWLLQDYGSRNHKKGDLSGCKYGRGCWGICTVNGQVHGSESILIGYYRWYDTIHWWFWVNKGWMAS